MAESCLEDEDGEDRLYLPRKSPRQLCVIPSCGTFDTVGTCGTYLLQDSLGFYYKLDK
jgi:hypothetical protein